MIAAFLVLQGTTPGQAFSDAALERVMRSWSVLDPTVVRTEFRALPRMLARQPFRDLNEAWAVRRSLARAVRERGMPGLVLLPSTTAALLQPKAVLVRSAVRFDALASENRHGLGSVLSRLLERRYLRHVGLLLPYSFLSAAGGHRRRVLRTRPSVPFPTPISVEAVVSVERDAASVVAYCGNPRKKGLDQLLRAWEGAGPPAGAVLRLVGITAAEFDEYLGVAGIRRPDRVLVLGKVPHAEFMGLLSRSQVYLAAARYEDFGIAPLEAMAAGTVVVTTLSAGPFEAGALLLGAGSRRLVPAGDVEALGRALVDALLAPERELEVERTRGRLLARPYTEDEVLVHIRTKLLPALEQLALRGSGKVRGRR